MASDRDTALFDLRDLGRALALLTRLPAPGADGVRGAASAWAWPVVGLIVGGLSGALASAALALGLSPGIAAGLALGAGIVMTGALHEDGLADCADGFWGGRDSDRRLEIMKDSRIGAYGVLALILAIGLRWVTVTALIGDGALWAAALVPAALSRGAMGGVMATLPFARPDGFARHVGAPSGRAALVGLGLAALAAIGLAGGAGIATLVAAGAAATVVVRIAMGKIGGQTGDVLGAVQQASELAALLTLAAFMTP